MLAACAGPAPAPPPPPRVAVVPPPPAPPAPVHHRKAPPVPERKPTPPAAAGDQNPAGSLAMVEPSPPASAAAPNALIGLDQAAARRRFGNAAEQSEEPPATVWRYWNGVCELDLYFYLDLRSGRMRTLHYAVKGAAEGPAGQQQCVRSLTVASGNG